MMSMESQREPTGAFDPFSLATLEFPAVVEMLAGFLSGPISEPLLDALEPTTVLPAIRRDLELVREALAYRRESSRPSLGRLKDTRELLERVAVEGVSLGALEILAVVEVARAARDVRSIFLRGPHPRLDELVRGFADFRPLLAELDGKIFPDGSIDSSASPELARIRRSIERLRVEIQTTLERLVRRLEQEELVQDAVVMIRNDRFVIPVRVEDKRRVAGIVHGASSSGASVFIEPMETVPLNNELVEQQDREYAEIQRILAVFSARLRGERAELGAAAEILGRIDLTFAKAEFARNFDCCLPQFSDGRALAIKDVRHPLLEKALQGQTRKSVPLTLELAPPKTMMVVSGPNTGGKTVALKTVGLAVLMAQAGLPVLASEVQLPIFGRVLADIGDQQSIEANLSTFSAHVTNIQAMARVAEPDDLVLLDELGASTEPNEGAALAIAILEHFRARRAMTFVTTHHTRLKAYATETQEALNAAMEFDEQTLQPTYRLLVGLPGKSSALDIAERLGLEETIVHKARSLLHPADAEAASLVASLHQLKARLEAETSEITKQRQELDQRQASLEKNFEQERRAKLKELDARLNQTVKAYDLKWEQALSELRAQTGRLGKKAERRPATMAQEVREEWNAQVLETLGVAPSEAPELLLDVPPKVGDRVRVADVPTAGRILEKRDEDDFEVEVGRLKMRVRREQIKVLADSGTAGEGPGKGISPTVRVAGGRFASAPDASAASAIEINVIGTTAEEACEQVDKFLDRAFLNGRFRVRVIHGFGKGILRKALHDLFAAHLHVEKYYAAPQHEGAGGATIVELKL
jgi:DNA mismatch repair protein MutS2